jgi:ABC-type glycerol-3-phosphate transport system permease component
MMRSPLAARLTTVLLVLLFMLPLAWALVASFTPEQQMFGGAVPSSFSIDHYRALFATRDFWTPIRNSLIVALLTTAVALLVSVPCAYALVRLPVVGGTAILGFVLAVSMFPQIAMVPSLYLVLRTLRLLDTYAGLVLPYLTFAVPLAVWLLSGFFRQLPIELEEAAMLDGANRLRTLAAVVLPLSWPGVATTAILVFLYSWNEFLFALSFTLGPERYTVPVAITLFRGQYQVPWGEVLAAAVVATAAVAVVVLVAQRRIVAGLTAGAVKG